MFVGIYLAMPKCSCTFALLCHCLMVLSKQKYCFSLTGILVSTESQKTHLCTSDKAGCFSNKKYDWYKCSTCAWLCEAFTLLMENMYREKDEI